MRGCVCVCARISIQCVFVCARAHAHTHTHTHTHTLPCSLSHSSCFQVQHFVVHRPSQIHHAHEDGHCKAITSVFPRRILDTSANISPPTPLEPPPPIIPPLSSRLFSFSFSTPSSMLIVPAYSFYRNRGMHCQNVSPCKGLLQNVLLSLPSRGIPPSPHSALPCNLVNHISNLPLMSFAEKSREKTPALYLSRKVVPNPL